MTSLPEAQIQMLAIAGYQDGHDAATDWMKARFAEARNPQSQMSIRLAHPGVDAIRALLQLADRENLAAAGAWLQGVLQAGGVPAAEAESRQQVAVAPRRFRRGA